MSTSTIIPRDDTSKRVLLQQLNTRLPNYASVLDITESDLAQLRVGLDWFNDSLKSQDTMKTTPTPSSEPYANIFGFLGALIARTKSHKNYTDAIGKGWMLKQFLIIKGEDILHSKIKARRDANYF
ncbi:MAG: hypothetical protein WCP96_10760 [Methylococcaceae bacterium]